MGYDAHGLIESGQPPPQHYEGIGVSSVHVQSSSLTLCSDYSPLLHFRGGACYVDSSPCIPVWGLCA